MGKIIGLLLVVGVVWVMVEVYTEGTQNAFGGALATLSGAAGEDRGASHSAAMRERTRETVERAHAEAARRREALLRD